MGLVKPSENRNGFFDFDKVTGGLYMAFLANYIASRKRLPVVTDDILFQPLIRSIQQDGAEEGVQADIGHQLASIVIQCAIPQPLENIPIRKIIRFRKHDENGKERSAFYNEINKLVTDLQDVPDHEALQEILNKRGKDIENAADNLKSAYRGVRIAAVTGLMGLSVPAVFSGLGPVIGGFGVAAASVGKIMSAAIDIKKAKAGSPHAYVLSLQKLKSTSLAEDIIKRKLIF